MKSCIVVRTTEELVFAQAVVDTGTWHHIAVAMKNRGRGKSTTATVFINGLEMESKKAPYPGSGPPAAANSDTASQICFRIGTSVRDRCVCRGGRAALHLTCILPSTHPSSPASPARWCGAVRPGTFLRTP